MNLALWIGASLLAVVALTGGVSKAFVPKERLAAIHGGGWTAGVSGSFVKSLGILELLAAAGLVLPAAVNIAPVLVPVTAVGWVLLMVGATITHGRRPAGQDTIQAAMSLLVPPLRRRRLSASKGTHGASTGAYGRRNPPRKAP